MSRRGYNPGAASAATAPATTPTASAAPPAPAPVRPACRADALRQPGADGQRREGAARQGVRPHRPGGRQLRRARPQRASTALDASTPSARCSWHVTRRATPCPGQQGVQPPHRGPADHRSRARRRRGAAAAQPGGQRRLQHTWIGDLVVTLVPPAASGIPSIKLHDRAGGSTRDLRRSFDASTSRPRWRRPPGAARRALAPAHPGHGARRRRPADQFGLELRLKAGVPVRAAETAPQTPPS